MQHADVEIIVERDDGFQRHVEGALNKLLVVLLQQDGADQPHERRLFAKHTNNVAAPLDLAVQPFYRVGGVYLGPALCGEPPCRQTRQAPRRPSELPVSAPWIRPGRRHGSCPSAPPLTRRQSTRHGRTKDAKCGVRCGYGAREMEGGFGPCLVLKSPSTFMLTTSCRN